MPVIRSEDEARQSHQQLIGAIDRANAKLHSVMNRLEVPNPSAFWRLEITSRVLMDNRGMVHEELSGGEYEISLKCFAQFVETIAGLLGEAGEMIAGMSADMMGLGGEVQEVALDLARAANIQ